MEIKINLQNEEDILGSDPGLSFGWITVVDRAFEINFFKDKMCMVFLTTASLIDNTGKLLKDPVQKLEWVGDGYGAILRLSNQNNKIVIEGNNFRTWFDIEQFAKTLIETVSLFLKNCRNKNAATTDDFGFQALEEAVIDFKRIL